jgi:hypothetical protein
MLNVLKLAARSVVPSWRFTWAVVRFGFWLVFILICLVWNAALVGVFVVVLVGVFVIVFIIVIVVVVVF